MTTILYEKPEALREICTDQHGIIAASAGTGKTYTLQHLVVEILLAVEEVRLDEILLVTFTVAATSDLKAKIRGTLEDLIEGWELARARGLDVAEFRDGELEKWSSDEVPDTFWSIDLEGVKRLRHGLRNFDRAAIYTIHGFCQRILVEHAFANKRLFDQEHVSEEDVIAEAFADMLREEIRPGTDQEQWLMAYLGAGNDIEGLQDVLAKYVRSGGDYRPVETVDLEAFENYIHEFAVVLREVDVKQWNEAIKPAVQAADGPTVTTAKTVGRRVTKLKEKFLPRVEEGNPVATLFALNQTLGRKDFEYFRKPDAQVVLDVDESPVGELLQELDEFEKNCELLVVLKLGVLLAERVASLKSQEGYFTFSDMVRVVRDTLIDGDDGGHLLASIRDEFRYGLIDEFQDTDAEQWEIFEKVFVDSPDEDRHFLYLIGDPKQAIYGFRGGDVYTYLDACDQLRALGARETSLKDNYRSTPAVLDACNAIFSRDAESVIDLGDRIQYEKGGVNPGKDWLNLQVSERDSNVGMTAFALTTDKEKVGTDDVRMGLIDQYAREIERIVSGERQMKYPTDENGEEFKNVGAEEIYVLGRRRADLQTMADALRVRDVPFAFLKMPGLFQTVEASDVYDLLLAIDDPYHRSRRARAWMTPFFDLTLKDIEGLSTIEEREEIFEKLLGWSRLARQVEFGELFNRVLEDSGLIRRKLLLERGERELTNYLHIFDVLANEGARKVRSTEELAARLKAFMEGRASVEGDDAEQQRLETEEAAVQLLTIHGSKGLQRGVVFVIPKFGGISKRNPPFRFHESTNGSHRRVEWHDRFKKMSKDEQERYVSESESEELRLIYVALTRAELMVYVPWAASDSSVLQNRYISADPFVAVMNRMQQVGDEADFIEFRPTPLELSKIQPTAEEVRAGLENMTLPVEETAEKIDEVALLNARRELMLRRWEVTSYSKQKKRVRTTSSIDEKGDDDAPTGVLPGGMTTGNFLHQVLEDLNYQLVDDFERKEWAADEDLRGFFKSRARRFGHFKEEAITAAMNITYDTLKTPLTLADGQTVDGIRRLEPDRVRREMEFLFPVPELDEDGETWQRVFRSGAEIDGGFATGIVDLLFEHEGKVYFADWKSDRAHPFDENALGKIIEERYSTQANLYSLALCRMLGIEDEEDYDEYFGGYYYFFVRGMAPGSEDRGIYANKVPWEKLAAYEATLAGVVREEKTKPLEEEKSL